MEYARVKEFFVQAPRIAVAKRLAQAEAEVNDYGALRDNIENYWECIKLCYLQKDWERLILFREAIQPFLDLQSLWNYSVTLNQWTIEAAQAREDYFNEARWTHDLADMLNQQGKYHEAERLYQKSEEIYYRLGHEEWALKSRHMRSMVVRAQGRQAEAKHLCQSTIDDARRLNLGVWLAHPLYVLALLARDQGDMRYAGDCVKESLSLLQNTDGDAMKGQCFSFLGEIALHQHEFVEARIHLQASLQMAQQTKVVRRVATARRLLGDLALAEGKYQEAAEIYQEVMKMFEDGLDDKPALAQTLFSRARLMMRMKKIREASEMLEGSVFMYEEAGNARRIIAVSLFLIKVYAQQGRWLQICRRSTSILKVAFSAE